MLRKMISISVFVFIETREIPRRAMAQNRQLILHGLSISSGQPVEGKLKKKKKITRTKILMVLFFVSSFLQI